MKTYTAEELAEIIKKHGMWLRDEDGGERANLSYANLRSANLRSANLRSADLSYANLRSADLSYANLSYANLSYADLRSADLSYANLSYANLRSADLRSADLRSANLRSAAGNSEHIKSIFVSEEYPIVYTVYYLQIGCERHLISEWSEFDDARIVQMDGKKALEFWRKYKEFIFMSIQIAPAKHTGFVAENG
jgi:uncharacterized protein YjbI with pentapeptide repeats